MLSIQGKICLATSFFNRLTGNSSVSKTDSTTALMTVTGKESHQPCRPYHYDSQQRRVLILFFFAVSCQCSEFRVQSLEFSVQSSDFLCQNNDLLLSFHRGSEDVKFAAVLQT